MLSDEDSRSALEDLLDNLELYSGRKDDQRSAIIGSDVRLNIYDMMALNEYTSKFGMGVFHSGVEVYGKEYAYGGHPYSFTGIYEMSPRQEVDVAGHGGVQFKESLYIGHTSLNAAAVDEMIKGLGKEYNGNVYHIFSKNCNHFSAELCYKLSGKNIPPWVNRLAYIGSWMPFVVACLPPSWVSPIEPAIEDASREDLQEIAEEEGQASAVENQEPGNGEEKENGDRRRKESKDKDDRGRRGSKDKDSGRRGSKDKSGRKNSKDGSGGERKGSRDSGGRKWSGGGLFLYSMSGSHSPASRRVEVNSEKRTKENC